MRAAEDPDARAPVQDADDDAVHSARERMGMEDALLNASTIASDAVPSEVDAVPHDRYHLAFFILYLQGVGCLFPWNAFITKTDYYALAFRGSEYASSFESVVTTTFTLLGLVTILGMQRVQHLSSPRSRIIGGLTLQLGVFLVIFGFSAAPLVLPTEQLAPFLQRTRAPLFAVTVAGVALAGFAQSVITGSIFTYATLYARPIYLQAISAGMGVAGLSVSLGSLATALPQTAEACAPDGDEADSAQVDRATVVGAAVYFGLSCVLLGLCLAAFFALERLPFTLECKKREALLTMAEEGRLEERRLAERRLAAVRPRTVPETETEMPLSLANVAGAGRGGGGGEAATAAAAGVAAKATPPALLPQLWAWALSLMLVYVVTLGLFPSLTSTIQSTAGSCSWQHMFVPVHPRTAPHSPSQPLAAPRSRLQPLIHLGSPPRQVGFVVYNAGDTLGRNLPGAVRTSRRLLGLTLLRTAFIPLFMMCNVIPSSGASPLASVPLASDAWPLLVMAAFSLSNGWLTSCALMHAPEAVPPSERGRAGSLMICFLNAGLFVGSALSFAVKSTMCGGCNPFVNPAAAQSQ